ncbi:MAG: hypothetical protein AAGJ73_13340 [Pseudomonadota bacterium]
MTAGAMSDLPLATAAIFFVDKLYGGAETGRLAWTGGAYFLAWALGSMSAFQERPFAE